MSRKKQTDRSSSSPPDLKMMSRNTNKQPSRQSDDLLRNSKAGAAEKVLTDKEIPTQPPNVIARLMGVDAIPTPNTIIQVQAEIKVVSPRSSAPFKQAKCSSLLPYRSRNNGGDSGSAHCLKKKTRVPGRSRSRQRRHPQEDLLQKIKQDFQAWQASRALGADCSATTVAASKDLDSRRVQMIAQENLRKQKMARYGLANSKATMEDENSSLQNIVQQSGSESAAIYKVAVAAEPRPDEKAAMTVLPRAASPCAASSENSGDFDHSATDEELLLQSRTPILLLKPTSSDGQGKQLLFGLPKVKRDGNMTRFLQEVKEMLQKELKANTTRSELNTVTCWGTEEEAAQISRDIANQTKETVSKHDHGRRLFRSEAFRGFRSDRKRKEANTTKTPSPEHVRIVVARNILAHRRLKSLTSITETVPSPKKDDDEESTSSCSITTSRERAIRSLADVSPSSGIINGLGEQSFRSECLMKHKDDAARALFRSFSAPELGFSISLGRMFVGDGSVRSATPTHEASEGGAASMTSKNNTALGFIRGTVSSLRHSFSLPRNLLFRRKTHWSKKTSLGLGELHPQTPPETTFNLFKVAQANLTELPPSPVSLLEVVAGHSCRHFFSDFNCQTLPELMSPKCLSEFEAPASELSYRTDITVETSCNSQDKAYIREVLVAAGLYDDGSLDSNKATARVDSMARPICDDIFEEVEDMYYYRGEYCDDAIGVCSDAGGKATDHRMLFDLANEALQSLVRGAKKKTGSSLRQWVIDSTGVSRGRRLVDDVWQQVQTLRNPQMQEMQTIDSMVAYEIRSSAWAEALYEDAYVVGRKIERAIFDELIEDLVTQDFI